MSLKTSAHAIHPVSWSAYGLAPVAVALALLVSQAVARFLPHANLSLVFLTAVLMVASRTGLWPALLTALLSFFAYNFFFIAPQFTFLVNDDGDVATLLFFLLIAAVTGNLAARMRCEMEKGESNIRSLSSLHAFGQQMLSAVDEAQVRSILQQQLQGLHRLPVQLLLPPHAEPPQPAAQGDTATVDPQLVGAAWNSPGADPIQLGGWTFYRLATSRGHAALMAVPSAVPDAAVNDLSHSLCQQASLALDRMLLATELAEARLVSETEQLRSALLSSVSHDLRTPLASIIGSTSSLHDYGDAFSSHDRQDLLATVLSEARRLDRYIQNLLDMTRIGQGPMTLDNDWVDVRDLIASASARLQSNGDDLPPVDIRLDSQLPMLWAHGVLIEQAIVNLLDNAARFSPPGGQVTIAVYTADEQLVIEVCDEGPGIPADEKERVFEMFYTACQGDCGIQQGTGLGLAICRGLIGAHGGTITAHDRPGGPGACLVIRLPLTRPAAESADD